MEPIMFMLAFVGKGNEETGFGAQEKQCNAQKENKKQKAKTAIQNIMQLSEAEAVENSSTTHCPRSTRISIS